MNAQLKKLVLFFCSCTLPMFYFAQKGKDGNVTISSANTIVNSYTSVTSDLSTGATTINITSSAGFNPGDLVMLIQMQGAKVNAGKDTISGNLTNSIPSNISYGEIKSYNNCGNNEFAEVNAVPNSTSITVDCGIKNDYTSLGKVQVIKVPRYASLIINGSITCPAWNGTTGGVIVVEVDGPTTLNSTGALTAIAKGFRGGGRENASVFGSLNWGSTSNGEGGYKGEGIAGDTSFYKTAFAGVFGRGAVANAGGGGDAHNAGGGGGANGGNPLNWNGMGIPNSVYSTIWALEGAGVFNTNYAGGGRGGYTFSNVNSNINTTAPGNLAWGGDSRRNFGGVGGRPLDYSTGRLFLGGGGGSGDENDNMSAPTGQASGGNGGGLIYILSYGNVSGNGTIVSDGSNGSNTNNASIGCSGKDGAGGGGGGGTVIINSNGTINLTAATAISVKGGKGGNQNFGSFCTSSEAYGPGGGGGGGYIGISSSAPGVNVAGGLNGIVSGNSGTIAANFPPNGATAAGNGSQNTYATVFTIKADSVAICSGNSTTLTATLLGNVPSPSPTINWYSTQVGGTALASGASFSTPLLTANTTYYVGTCPGTYRIPVIVRVYSILPSPKVSNPKYCLNAIATPLTASANAGNSLNWYITSTGGTPSLTAPTPNTSVAGVTIYYVSQGNGNCESARIPITVQVIPSPMAPAVTSPLIYCQNDIAPPLSAIANGTNTLQWWGTSISGGTSSSIAPSPSTAIAGNTVYYVSQDSLGCQGPRSPIQVTVNPKPTAPNSSNVSYCQNAPAVALTATGSNNLEWWTQAAGGNPLSGAPVPSTLTVGTTTYYVSQTNGNCSSDRIPVIVTISPLPVVPSATNNSISYCQNAIALPLSAMASNGNSLNWYTTASGGTSSANAPIPSTSVPGSFDYYVSQGTAPCESDRVKITVNINPKPIISFISNLTTICAAGCINFIDNSSVNCNSLIWSFGDGSTAAGSNPKHCYPNPGAYTVKAVCKTAAGCADSSIVNNMITVVPLPKADFTYSPSSPINAGTLVSFNSTVTGVTEAWNFGDQASGINNISFGNSPNHTFLNPGNYCVLLVVQTNVGNCKDSVSNCIEVQVEEQIVIPNIFTPNDDTKNDVFSIQTSGIKDLSCAIYDRWGIKVYDWEGITGHWDGKSKNGNKVPDGTYFYVVHSTNYKGKMKSNTGYLQIIK